MTRSDGMLIVIIVLFALPIPPTILAFRAAAKQTRSDRARAIDSDAPPIFKGHVTLNAVGNRHVPGLYELVLYPEQLQFQVPDRASRLTTKEWYLETHRIATVAEHEDRFLWSLRARPAIRLEFLPSHGPPWTFSFAPQDGRVNDLVQLLQQVVEAARSDPPTS